MFKASGLPASLKGEILCHNCLGCGHVAKDKSGKPVCSSAVKPRQPGDWSNDVRFFKLPRNTSGSRLAIPGGHRNQQYKGSSGDKPKLMNLRFKRFELQSKKINKNFMLGTDDDGNLSALTFPSRSSSRLMTTRRLRQRLRRFFRQGWDERSDPQCRKVLPLG
eukprot:6201833-Pleurochrysis_carterae.AAC.2